MQTGYVPSNYVRKEKPSIFDSIKKKVINHLLPSVYVLLATALVSTGISLCTNRANMQVPLMHMEFITEEINITYPGIFISIFDSII